MAAITPYPKYSGYQHLSFNNLTPHSQKVLSAIFPDDSFKEAQISVFFVMSSAGKYSLLLSDAVSFMNLRNSVDTLSEIFPVIFDCGLIDCSNELLQAVRDHGVAITESPHFVALEIDHDMRNVFSRTFRPSYSGSNPQAELIRAINAQASGVYIGKYHVRRIENTWQPPVANPNWQGMAFEQSDRIIRTWLHEKNPRALQSALDDAQKEIDKAKEEEKRITTDIQNNKNWGKYKGQLQEKLDAELADIQQTLQELHNRLTYLTAQTVNSAAKTTLQCAITIQVDQSDKIQLLERFVCQRIAIAIDRALHDVSWEDLPSGMTSAIENFIKQRMKALEKRISILAERSIESEAAWKADRDSQPDPIMVGGRAFADANFRGRAPANVGVRLLTDWNQFIEEVLPKRQRWVKGTFQEFCQERIGHTNPTPSERQALEKPWKQELNKKLQWVTSSLSKSDDDLKILADRSFVDIDIGMFDGHREHMLKVLRKTNQFTYGLGLELDELYKERDFLRSPARHHGCVHLVKRLTTSGQVCFGITPSPASPGDRPDPNSDLNEVHIPVFNVPSFATSMPLSIQRVPPKRVSHTWKWIAAGVFGVMGAFVVGKHISPLSYA